MGSFKGACLALMIWMGSYTVVAQNVPVTPAPGAAASPTTGQASGSDASSQTPGQPYTIQAGARVVLVPTSVEVKGKMLYGLTAKDFQIEDNGVPQNVTLDDSIDAPGLSLVVLLQCSRSAIAEYAKLQDLPTMVDGLVGAAPREVALVRYGSHPELVQPFSRNMDEVLGSMSRMGPCEDDKAATVDAVSYAASILANRRDKFRHVILLISETRDHGSTVKESHVVEQLGRTNTVVDAVAFSPVKSETVQSLVPGRGGMNPLMLLFAAVQAVRQNAPKTLARLSGGEYLNFTTQKGFENGMYTLANHVHDYYLLSFPVASTLDDGLHSIKVKVPAYPDAVIRSRETYFTGQKHAPDVPADSTKDTPKEQEK